jgi:hypothetical protein
MMARLRSVTDRFITFWFHWASFKLGLFAGCVIGMVVMAVIITAVFTAPDAIRLLTERVLP